MDKMFFYIYRDLYKHLYKFCISANPASKEALEKMEADVKRTSDVHLEECYRIAVIAVNVGEKGSRQTLQEQTGQYEKALALDDYRNRWCLYSILQLIYKYIYPDSEKIEKCEDEISRAAEELDKMGETDYQFKFEDADYTIQMHINKGRTMYGAYKMHHEGKDFKLKNRSFMIILKGYSSSTPFFYPALRERFHNIPIKGGGIYIKWNGTGIAIDPGINFVENLHIAGLSIDDIDIIIVTHNHIDHNGDLATIDDLASYVDKKDISLYMDKNTEKEFSGRLINFKEENRHGLDLLLLSKEGFTVGDKKNIIIKTIPTKHIVKEIIKNEDEEEYVYVTNVTYAVKISLKENEEVKAVIGYTSDTVYLEELGKIFQDCDYVIANMSETSPEDYSKKKKKEKHLGYAGGKQLIEDCIAERTAGLQHMIVAGKPRYIVSEFWAGKGDVRRELIKRLRQETGYQYVYPGDIGMLFFLDQPHFLCGLCGSERSLECLNVIRPGLEYSSFVNVCSECIL